MIRAKYRRWGPVGVEFGGRSINAVQASSAGDDLRVEAACSIAREGAEPMLTATDIARLVDVFERQGFRGQRVVVAMPPTDLVTAQLELEPAAPAVREKRAHEELAAAHQRAPEHLVSASWDVPTPNPEASGRRVHAVGCPRDSASTLLDVFEAADLGLVAIDVESQALVRACAAPLGQGLSAALIMGWSATSLVVIANGVVVYERSLAEAGCAQLHESLCNEMGLDPDVADHVLTEIGLTPPAELESTPREFAAAARERILNWVSSLLPEIRLSLGYAAHEYGRDAVDGILMTGEAASIPDLREHLTKELGVETTSIAPSDVASSAPGAATASTSPAMTVALGLSLYGRSTR